MISLDSEETLQLGEVDPLMKAHLEENPESELPESEAARRALGNQYSAFYQKHYETPPPGVRRSVVPYITTDGVSVRSVLLQPDNDAAALTKRPLIILIHGGGFFMGCAEFEEETCLSLVKQFNAVCYSISYRLAPEHKFPTAVNDCWDAFRFAISQAELWGADPVNAGFIVGGTSAGGNLAAGIALRARDESVQPPITGQWLAVPWLCPSGELPEPYRATSRSYQQNAKAPALSTQAIDTYVKAYEPVKDDDRCDIMSHSKGHAGLPPTFIQVAGLDPLRDENMAYEEILRSKYGVKTRIDVYPGLPHVFWLLYPGLKKHVAKFNADQLRGFTWLLNNGK